MTEVLTVPQGDLRLPVRVIEMGSQAAGAPAIGFFGGVHGVERIGTQVILSWLHSLIHRLQWDDQLHRRLEHIRLVFMPMVNPGGVWRRTRSNPNGVDLMRNAPVEADGRVSFLVGGQRISRHLPWFRGRAGDPMEAEAQALVRVVEEKLLRAPVSLSLTVTAASAGATASGVATRAPTSRSPTWPKCTGSSRCWRPPTRTTIPT